MMMQSSSILQGHITLSRSRYRGYWSGPLLFDNDPLASFSFSKAPFLCCSTASDWQEEALLDNCGDDSEEVDAHSGDQQPKPRVLGYYGASRWLVWKQRLRRSLETLRHFGSASPPQYSINEDNIKPPVTTTRARRTKDWPLTNLDVEAAGPITNVSQASEATAVHLPLPARH